MFILSDGVHSPMFNGFKRHHNYTTEVRPLLYQIKSYFNISKHECDRETYPKITILNRKERKREREILNTKCILDAFIER